MLGVDTRHVSDLKFDLNLAIMGFRPLLGGFGIELGSIQGPLGGSGD